MRKFSYLFGTAVIAAAMCACSDDTTSDVTAAGTETATGDVTYLNVSLAMAGSGSLTRADDGSTYEYGEEYENAVETCTLLFYDGEGNFLALRELDDNLIWKDNTDPNNIASTASQVVALSGLSTIPTKVLAIINGTASDYNNESLKTVLAMTVTDAPTSSSTSGDFIMSNSVYVKDGAFVYAEPISDKCLFESESDAENATEDETLTIYVEREVAKVTINVNTKDDNDTSNTSNIENDEDGTYYAKLDGTHIIWIGEDPTEYTDATFRICIDGWAVNATNDEGYLVKNVNEDWLNDGDFIEGTWYNSSDHRTWWAKDDNYDSNKNVSYLSWQEVADNETSTDAAYYHENTANYDVQIEYNQPGKDAYTPTLMVAAHVEVSTASDTEDFTNILEEDDNLKNLYYKGGVYYDEAALKYYIAKEYNETNNTSVTVDEITNITITSDDEGTCNINGTEVDGETLDMLTDIELFVESACYYQKPISQDITSGDIDDGEDSSAETTEYCGLVRNHSYYITLNSITGVGGNIIDKEDEDGEPEIPGEETTYYLNTEINILQWRVVTEQEVNF